MKMVEPKWKEEGIKDMDKVKKFIEKYRFSSYLDYKGQKRNENRILNMDSLPEYFDNAKEFDDYLTDWLGYHAEEPLGLA